MSSVNGASCDSSGCNRIEISDFLEGPSTVVRKAIAHLAKIVPASERTMPTVLMAAELLTNAAEHGGPIEFARIATLQALNRHAERQFNPDRKDPHWGRRKLKRDTV